MKANFEFEENWNINAVPVEKQKLDEIKKQKPEETKKIQDRNKERARKTRPMKKNYIQYYCVLGSLYVPRGAQYAAKNEAIQAGRTVDL